MAVVQPIQAAPPPGYYDAAQGQAGAELRAALHQIIRRHHVIPYSSSTALDTSDALKVIDRDATATNLVALIYSETNAPASTFGLTGGWNREHLWCNSYGIDSAEPSYSDLHNLRPADANVNSARGNKYYDVSDTNSAGYHFPAHVEAPRCSTDSDSWEPPASQRGDIARALFYMATRYTGDTNNEPALVLTDTVILIQSTNANMGRLATLLAWHQADPVDTAERLRNDRVYSYQTNRNPFVDHPEWVNLALAPPSTNAPTLAVARAGGAMVLSWRATNQSAHLEYTTTLPGGWLAVTNPPVLTSLNFSVAWTNTGAMSFFRLKVD